MNISQILLSAVLMTATSVAIAGHGDAAAGATKSKTCAACHGNDGNSVVAINPSLAGQNRSYLAQALKDYRAGKRKNPIMNGMAASLKDDDIADLAAYFSSQQGKLVMLPVR
jgi:cytochrome c553